MKSLMNNLIVAVVFFTLATTAFAETAGSINEYQEISKKLEAAVLENNYKEAKLSLFELIPLMKQNIKESKKSISQAKKTNDPDLSPDDMMKVLKRKAEIYDKLDHIATSSPAAMRVKAKEVLSLIKEFDSLN